MFYSYVNCCSIVHWHYYIVVVDCSLLLQWLLFACCLLYVFFFSPLCFSEKDNYNNNYSCGHMHPGTYNRPIPGITVAGEEWLLFNFTTFVMRTVACIMGHWIHHPGWTLMSHLYLGWLGQLLFPSLTPGGSIVSASETKT